MTIKLNFDSQKIAKTNLSKKYRFDKRAKDISKLKMNEEESI